jgi:hypothetical protein
MSTEAAELTVLKSKALYALVDKLAILIASQ